MERRYTGKGHEHHVVRPITGKPDIVLKTPRFINRLSLMGNDPTAIVRQEIKDSKASLNENNVVIPRTLIMRADKKIFGILPIKGYVIGQKYIEKNDSFYDIEAYLKSKGSSSLMEEYKESPTNFIYKDGVIYWIDPTKGAITRVFERMGISIRDYRKLRNKIRRIIRFFDS